MQNRCSLCFSREQEDEAGGITPCLLVRSRPSRASCQPAEDTVAIPNGWELERGMSSVLYFQP